MVEIKDFKVRGCGTRVKGGIYTVVETSKFGTPVEDFLYCPPHPFSDEEISSLGISSQGMTLINRDGYVLMFDWVGRKHYPTVPDFVEETARMGASRRLPKTLDFSKLNHLSRHLLIHSRACILDPEPYYHNHQRIEACPRNYEEHNPLHAHQSGFQMCTGLLWEAVEKREGDRKYWRERPGVGFIVASELPDTCFQSGIFMWLPINRIEVVEDDLGGRHEKALEIASRADLPVELVSA